MLCLGVDAFIVASFRNHIYQHITHVCAFDGPRIVRPLSVRHQNRKAVCGAAAAAAPWH